MENKSSAGSNPTTPLVDSTRRRDEGLEGRGSGPRRLAATCAGLGLLFGCLAPLQAEPPRVSCDELRRLQLNRERLVLIDVRPAADYLSSHIQGARNVPARAVTGAELNRETPIVVYCSEHPCALSQNAAETLIKAGHPSVSVLDGGLGEWVKRGYPVAKGGEPAAGKAAADRITVAEARERLAKGGLAALDARPRREFAAGHVPGARNIPLEELSSSLGGLSKDAELVVYDRVPERSRKAAEVLLGAGFKVSELSGGLAGWAARGYALEVK